MKNAAARVFYPVLIALLSASISVGGCAAYNKCVKPEITAATKLAPADLLKEVSAFLLCGGPDLPDLAAPCAVKGLADLAEALGPGGAEAVNCLVSYLEGNATDPALKARAKAVGAKRGVTPELFSTHACSSVRPTLAHDFHASPGDRLPGASAGRMDPARAPAEAQFSYAEPNHGASLAHCYRDCGDNAHGAIAPPGGCQCWRRVGSTWRWVAIADRGPRL